MRFYQNAPSAIAASIQLKEEFKLDVSPRTITHWAKIDSIKKAAGSPNALFVEQNLTINNIKPVTGQKFDYKDFAEQSKKFFDKSNQKINAILKLLYETIKAEDITEMSLSEKLNAIAKLEKLKIAKSNFILSVISRSADDEEDLTKLVDELAKELNGDERESISEQIESKVADNE